MTLQIDVEWPVTLPLPLIDFSAQPINTTLISPPRLFAQIRRSRFTRTYTLLSVAWMLTNAEYAALKEFIRTDLDNGAAQFKIELKYPKNSELTEWAVALGPIQSTHQDGMWSVQSVLQLTNPIEL